MLVTQYLQVCTIWFMWPQSYYWVSMVFADGLVLIWHQSICKPSWRHTHDIGLSAGVPQIYASLMCGGHSLKQKCSSFWLKNFYPRLHRKLSNAASAKNIVNMTTSPFQCLCLSLQWRHNERDGISNHQPHNCLPNRIFRRRSKKTSKLRVTGLWEVNSLGTGEFPAQMASNAANVSIWWRLHVVWSQTMVALGLVLAVICRYDSNVIIITMTSQITCVLIVYSTVWSGTDQRKHQSSGSLAFVRGIHRSPMNSPHKRPVTRKMFPFDDVIMGGILLLSVRSVTYDLNFKCIL